MAIQMRRGNEADLDISQLKAGEIAVCLDTGKTIVKLAGENYLTLTDTPELREIVDGKAEAEHTHDDRYYTESEIDTQLAAKSDTGHTHVAEDITDLESILVQTPTAAPQTILFDSPNGNNTSEIITLSDDINNYSYVELFYGIPSITAMTSNKTIPNNGIIRIDMMVPYADTNLIAFYNSMCAMQGDKLYRGEALNTLVNDYAGRRRDRDTSIHWGTSGTLEINSTYQTASDGFYLYIYRVIGYK